MSIMAEDAMYRIARRIYDGGSASAAELTRDLEITPFCTGRKLNVLKNKKGIIQLPMGSDKYELRVGVTEKDIESLRPYII